MGYGKVAPAPDMSIASAGPIAAAAMTAEAARVRKSFKALSCQFETKSLSRRGLGPRLVRLRPSCCCWCTVNNTPGATDPTRRVDGRFRGCPHPYASHVIVL